MFPFVCASVLREYQCELLLKLLFRFYLELFFLTEKLQYVWCKQQCETVLWQDRGYLPCQTECFSNSLGFIPRIHPVKSS